MINKHFKNWWNVHFETSSCVPRDYIHASSEKLLWLITSDFSVFSKQYWHSIFSISSRHYWHSTLLEAIPLLPFLQEIPPTWPQEPRLTWKAPPVVSGGTPCLGWSSPWKGHGIRPGTKDWGAPCEQTDIQRLVKHYLLVVLRTRVVKSTRWGFRVSVSVPKPDLYAGETFSVTPLFVHPGGAYKIRNTVFIHPPGTYKVWFQLPPPCDG